MRTLAPAVTLALAVLLPAPLAADAPPSQGEIAAREREKKKKKGKPITEADLHSTRGRGTFSSPGAENVGATAPAAGEEKKAEAGAAGGAAKAEKTEDELRAEAAAAWRKKIEAARADVTRLQTEVDQLQTALNDVTVQQVSPARAARIERLSAAKGELAAAQAQVTSLEEEGRRGGYR